VAHGSAVIGSPGVGGLEVGVGVTGLGLDLGMDVRAIQEAQIVYPRRISYVAAVVLSDGGRGEVTRSTSIFALLGRPRRHWGQESRTPFMGHDSWWKLQPTTTVALFATPLRNVSNRHRQTPRCLPPDTDTGCNCLYPGSSSRRSSFDFFGGYVFGSSFWARESNARLLLGW